MKRIMGEVTILFELFRNDEMDERSSSFIKSGVYKAVLSQR
jgi:hypothetical protein